MLNINKLKEALSGYIKVKLELFKLDIAEHLSRVLAQLVAYLVIFFILGLVILFVSLGVSLFLNEVLKSAYLGFIIVSGVYLVLLLFVFMLLKSGKLNAVFESILTPEPEDENLDADE